MDHWYYRISDESYFSVKHWKYFWFIIRFKSNTHCIGCHSFYDYCPLMKKFHFINWWWLLLTKFDLMIKRRCCHFLSLVFPLSICSYSSRCVLTLHNSSNLTVCSMFLLYDEYFKENLNLKQTVPIPFGMQRNVN